ncbi:neutral zinc metallopeptidase [Roseisolibacter sp. H3M3-2]|uniref:KPN_02809 family neutral zinc metallopeptidase n=1 Tax=Roseisolibacter sp. H3M3-2 TaxID=3031323 RepID=UPI0023DBCF63|nr:neutral zinc metallopeptidase [Roseisolibacter sp. H3M3-2]MDF1505379.1 zinc metallopeptidase [Roseisolibacter sp. H3M3-2]
MRWDQGSDRSNLEDRRGSPLNAGGGGGGALLGILASIVGRRFGILGVIAVMVIGTLMSGVFSGGGTSRSAGGEVAANAPVQQTAAEAQLVDFVTYVLNDSQDEWERLLPQAAGQQYRDARLVLFREGVATGCGNAPSAVGPFYCPADERVYIDLSFYDELSRRYGAPGDFAQAYVLAHEIGHHVQHVLGTDARVRQLQESRPDAQNPLSVRMELQADCYAGVWAYTVKGEGRLDPGDAEEALAAASAVGDDRLQQRGRGQVNPDSFTHGTAEQRARWFQRGFTSGDPRSCDTFAGGI